MPNGRLGRCIIPARKPAEIYHNTSGNAASVTLFANTISTDKNTEMSVVVGIASTTLQAETTEVTMAAGSFCSMTSVAYSCNLSEQNVGYSTFMGVFKPSQVNSCFSLSCMPMYAPDGKNLMDQTYQRYTDAYGCTMERRGDFSVNRFHWNCMCNQTCIPQSFGGNERQNPAIWMREGPASCNDHGPFYAGKIIGVWWNECCSCCWITNNACNGSGAGTWYPISARNVGMGMSARAASTSMQLVTNWCCCCGEIGDGSVTNCGVGGYVPVVRFDGCSSVPCCFGNHCNLMWCKRCACHCCFGAGVKLWNWYMLERSNYCCCENFTVDGQQCFCNTIVTQKYSNQCCASNIGEGILRGPLWMTYYWCCSCACGNFRGGAINTCWSKNAECGCICWRQWWTIGICSCEMAAQALCCSTKCLCHACTNNYMQNSWDHTYGERMSPYSAWFGMTNCSFFQWRCYDTSAVDGKGRFSFFHSFPDEQYMRRCMSGSYECYWFVRYNLYVDAPASSGPVNEGPIKYWAWNPHVINKHGSMGCTYIMSRSRTTEHCGIFSFDANDARVQQGPFCYCSGNANFCCGTWSDWAVCHCFNSASTCTITPFFTKVADFPTAMASDDYSSTSDKYMCMSCLFRTDYCTWVINIYNYRTGTWDGYYSSDLFNWNAVTSPYLAKVSDTLTTEVTADYACIINRCNCFFSNVDCSGIIDWKLSSGQYERTGLVLSDGDRIMVNNDSDVKLNVQVWGYEG